MREAWIWDFKQYLQGFPSTPFSHNEKMYFSVQFGSYVAGTVSLLFIETKQKDFWVMLTHHVTTLGLILFAWCLGYTRHGVAIMLIMDAADPWLEAAKITLYVGLIRVLGIYAINIRLLMSSLRYLLLFLWLPETVYMYFYSPHLSYVMLICLTTFHLRLV